MDCSTTISSDTGSVGLTGPRDAQPIAPLPFGGFKPNAETARVAVSRCAKKPNLPACLLLLLLAHLGSSQYLDE